MDIRVLSSGLLLWNGKTYTCALGKAGVTEHKKEGDGATPLGCFALREVLYRPDAISEIPLSPLPTSAIQESDGWCDDPADPAYNKKVMLPYLGRHEELWRTDEIYDVIVPLGYNDDPVVIGKGSAIFMHVARPNYPPTEGCVALALPDLLEILRSISKETKICIERE